MYDLSYEMPINKAANPAEHDAADDENDQRMLGAQIRCFPDLVTQLPENPREHVPENFLLFQPQMRKETVKCIKEWATEKGHVSLWKMAQTCAPYMPKETKDMLTVVYDKMERYARTGNMCTAAELRNAINANVF